MRVKRVFVGIRGVRGVGEEGIMWIGILGGMV